MPRRDTEFQDEWLLDENLKIWLAKGNNSKTAKCTLCPKVFDISNMGRKALESHAGGKKHKAIVTQRMCGSAIKIALEKPDDSGENSSALAQQSLENLNTDDARSNAATESRATVVAKSQPLIDTFLLKANVLEGEIIWALENTLNHQSFSSCESLSKLFTRMFSDSKIAEQFSLGKTKCRYYTVFGIAPYFKSLLVNSIKSAEYFVASYDESYNRVMDESQMDILIRYFDEESGKVNTRYYESKFLRRPNKDNLHSKLLEALQDENLPLQNMLQLSMDGPNVNLAVLKLHSTFRDSMEYNKIIDIGSCTLHVVHGAFKSAFKATTWDVHKILKAMFNLFHQAPARKDIYFRETRCDQLPLSFCGTRYAL